MVSGVRFHGMLNRYKLGNQVQTGCLAILNTAVGGRTKLLGQPVNTPYRANLVLMGNHTYISSLGPIEDLIRLQFKLVMNKFMITVQKAYQIYSS